MIQSNNFKFYSFNLHGGDDTRIPAKIYSEVFGWKIRSESPGHSELCICEDLVVVFSKPKENCPVESGTITFVTDLLKKDLGEHFKLDLKSKSAETYVSYLDDWGNRIWMYLKK